MTQHGQASVAEAARKVGHGLRLGQQASRGAILARDVAGHRLRIASVSGEVEGHGNVAIARKGQCEGLHQLLRSGKAMGNQHHRRRTALRRAIDGDRCGSDRHVTPVDTLSGRAQVPETHGNRGKCEDRDQDVDAAERLHLTHDLPEFVSPSLGTRP